MFGFSRRRIKLGRLKVHLGDPLQHTKSPLRPPKRYVHQSKEDEGSGSVLVGSGSSDEVGFHGSSAGFDSASASSENWMVVSTSGESPVPRFGHAAAVVGSKMVVVGGDSGRGLLDDTQILSLEKLTWGSATPRVYFSPTSLPLKIPACKGHSLVTWGKKVLLIGGKSDPASDRISVWSFDMETECWSHVEAKGDIPVARSGHSVTRAGPVLILFGGEKGKGKKLNDLHMLDLKSMMWLPLHYTGAGPSPRCNHVAALYDDRILFVFGGKSKSKILNDLYSLDFETMVWSRVKIRGHHPTPRAGCCGALCGNKWYIVGGGSKKKRYAETLVFDVIKLEMSVSVTSPFASITGNKGFSLVPVHHKDKFFLVAFGGIRKESTNQVEILIVVKDEPVMSWGTGQDSDSMQFKRRSNGRLGLGVHLKNDNHAAPVSRNGFSSTAEHHGSGRRSLSESSGNNGVSFRKQFHQEEGTPVQRLHNTHEDGCSGLQKTRLQEPNEVVVVTTDSDDSNDSKHENGSPAEGDGVFDSSNVRLLQEAKVTSLMRKNSALAGQLASAHAAREAAEKSLAAMAKAKQEAEAKLTETVKEVEVLKEKMVGLELAQEESNSLSNAVHSNNVRLEHDVAFLNAILDDTQKELHSTRGVLAAERARAFQLQVEVFHLKQRLQGMDVNRTPTPRKPYHS
ncbi:galactose oxidase/kelch repeat superfamily protein isoform X2 [Wolffia australiana]